MRASLTLAMNLDFVNRFPSSNLNRNPPTLPRTARYAIIVEMGHRKSCVRPTNTSIPLRQGSVLDAFRCIFIIVGVAGLSISISLKVRCTWGSNAFSDGTVSSPARKKPKKHTLDTAHNNESYVLFPNMTKLTE